MIYWWNLKFAKDIVPRCVMWKGIAGEDIRKQISFLMHFVKPMAKLVFLLRIVHELRPSLVVDVVARVCFATMTSLVWPLVCNAQCEEEGQGRELKLR